MFFSLFRQRERTKRDHAARFESDKITIPHILLRDSLRSNRSSQWLRHHVRSLDFITSPLAIAAIFSLAFDFCPHRGLDPLIPGLTRDLLRITRMRFRLGGRNEG